MMDEWKKGDMHTHGFGLVLDATRYDFQVCPHLLGISHLLIDLFAHVVNVARTALPQRHPHPVVLIHILEQVRSELDLEVGPPLQAYVFVGKPVQQLVVAVVFQLDVALGDPFLS